MDKVKNILGLSRFASEGECREAVRTMVTMAEAVAASRARAEGELRELRSETAELFCEAMRAEGVEDADVLRAARDMWVQAPQLAAAAVLGKADIVEAAKGCNQYKHKPGCPDAEGTAGEDKKGKKQKAKSVMEPGAIVKVKKEWLDAGESGRMRYEVIEESGPNRVLVRAINTGLPLPPTDVMDVSWIELADD